MRELLYMRTVAQIPCALQSLGDKSKQRERTGDSGEEQKRSARSRATSKGHTHLTHLSNAGMPTPIPAARQTGETRQCTAVAAAHILVRVRPIAAEGAGTGLEGVHAITSSDGPLRGRTFRCKLRFRGRKRALAETQTQRNAAHRLASSAVGGVPSQHSYVDPADIIAGQWAGAFELRSSGCRPKQALQRVGDEWGVPCGPRHGPNVCVNGLAHERARF